MENRELKPCPFCGSENVVLEPYKARKGYEATIQCNGGCLLHMHTITYDTEEEAVETVIKEWNKRAEKADTVREMQERLKEKAFSVPTVYNSHFGRMVDQIAKEMLDNTECKNKGEEICKNIHQKK